MTRRSAIQAEHQQLKYFEGNWTHKSTVRLGPGATVEGRGKTTVVPIHEGRYYQLTHEGDMGGQRFSSQGLLGYDNLRKQFVASSTDSFSTNLWVGHGTYDPSKKTYTFEGETPNVTRDGATLNVRQVRRIVDNDHYVFEWYENHGDKEIKTLEIEFTRA
nr:DUF1579 domain-containing protein [uncultured bacterium]